MHPCKKSDQKSKSELEEKIVRYHPEAVDELIDAAQFYESRSSGLGNRFIKSVDDAVRFIQRNPELFNADGFGRRKYKIKKFPFLLIYKVVENHIFILAVAHGRRKPGYWQSRDS